MTFIQNTPDTNPLRKVVFAQRIALFACRTYLNTESRKSSDTNPSKIGVGNSTPSTKGRHFVVFASVNQAFSDAIRKYHALSHHIVNNNLFGSTTTTPSTSKNSRSSVKNFNTVNYPLYLFALKFACGRAGRGLFGWVLEQVFDALRAFCEKNHLRPKDVFPLVDSRAKEPSLIENCVRFLPPHRILPMLKVIRDCYPQLDDKGTTKNLENYDDDNDDDDTDDNHQILNNGGFFDECFAQSQAIAPDTHFMATALIRCDLETIKFLLDGFSPVTSSSSFDDPSPSMSSKIVARDGTGFTDFALHYACRNRTQDANKIVEYLIKEQKCNLLHGAQPWNKLTTPAQFCMDGDDERGRCPHYGGLLHLIACCGANVDVNTGIDDRPPHPVSWALAKQVEEDEANLFSARNFVCRKKYLEIYPNYNDSYDDYHHFGNTTPVVREHLFTTVVMQICLDLFFSPHETDKFFFSPPGTPNETIEEGIFLLTSSNNIDDGHDSDDQDRHQKDRITKLQLLQAFFAANVNVFDDSRNGSQPDQEVYESRKSAKKAIKSQSFSIDCSQKLIAAWCYVTDDKIGYPWAQNRNSRELREFTVKFWDASAMRCKGTWYHEIRNECILASKDFEELRKNISHYNNGESYKLVSIVDIPKHFGLTRIAHYIGQYVAAKQQQRKNPAAK